MRLDSLGTGNGVHTPQINRLDNGLKRVDLHSECGKVRIAAQSMILIRGVAGVHGPIRRSFTWLPEVWRTHSASRAPKHRSEWKVAVPLA
jgi:hypothetical protein